MSTGVGLCFFWGGEDPGAQHNWGGVQNIQKGEALALSLPSLMSPTAIPGSGTPYPPWLPQILLPEMQEGSVQQRPQSVGW